MTAEKQPDTTPDDSASADKPTPSLEQTIEQLTGDLLDDVEAVARDHADATGVVFRGLSNRTPLEASIRGMIGTTVSVGLTPPARAARVERAEPASRKKRRTSKPAENPPLSPGWQRFTDALKGQ